MRSTVEAAYRGAPVLAHDRAGLCGGRAQVERVLVGAGGRRNEPPPIPRRQWLNPSTRPEVLIRPPDDAVLSLGQRRREVALHPRTEPLKRPGRAVTTGDCCAESARAVIQGGRGRAHLRDIQHPVRDRLDPFGQQHRLAESAVVAIGERGRRPDRASVSWRARCGDREGRRRCINLEAHHSSELSLPSQHRSVVDVRQKCLHGPCQLIGRTVCGVGKLHRFPVHSIREIAAGEVRGRTSDRKPEVKAVHSDQSRHLSDSPCDVTDGAKIEL